MNGYLLMSKWKEHCKKVKEIRKTCLQMLACPAATPEQLVEAQRILVKVMQSHHEMYPKVRAAWPGIAMEPEHIKED